MKNGRNRKENNAEKIKAFLHYIVAVIQCSLVKILRVFPLRKNRILFISFDGKQYSDNPKYISEAIKKKFKNKEIVKYRGREKAN